MLQVGYSLLDRGAHDLITKAGDRGIGIVIRSGLGTGWLTARALTVPPEQRPEKVNRLLALVHGDGERLHTLALAFLRAHPAISSILVGTKHLEHLRRNIEGFQSPDNPELLRRALEAV